MRIRALHAISLAVLLVTAGCIGGPTPGASTSTVTQSPGGSPTDTATVTATATETPTPVIQALPSTEQCAVDALPDPNRTDGLSLSSYPDLPATVTESSVRNYTMDFEEAYFRNAIIAEDAGDDMNLTRVSTHARPENVTKYRDGYVVVLAVSAGLKYESGTHGDKWPTVGYFVNETVLVRSHVEGTQSRVDPSSGTVLLRCEK